LYRWAQEREVTNLNATYIQDHTVEVEENALAEFDVTTVVTEEGRLHPNGLATPTE
jgi:hypothetical protein